MKERLMGKPFGDLTDDIISNPVPVDVMLCYVHVAYVHMAIQDLVTYSHALLGLPESCGWICHSAHISFCYSSLICGPNCLKLRYI